MIIDKTALLAALLATTTTLDVDGFGPVTLRQITVAENDALRAAIKPGDPGSDFGLRLVVACIKDADGQPVFTPDDLSALRAASGTKVDKLVEAVLLANGYTKPKPATDASNPDAAKNTVS